MKRLLLLLPLWLVYGHIAAQMPFTYVENQGQWADPFDYKSMVPGGAMFLQKTGITYHFVDYSSLHEAHLSPNPVLPQVIRGHAVKVTFVGANPNPAIESMEAQPQYYNYYLGNDRSRWKSSIHPVKKVLYRNVWPHIDILYYAAGGRMKYDFIVNPGGRVEDIRLRYEGQDALGLDGGKLVMKTSLEEVTEEEPYTYQRINGNERPVPCGYQLNGNELMFYVSGVRDENAPLVIDPTLIFASYTGSTADNFGMTATYDNAGHFYTGGTAFDIGFPTTPGAYQTTTTTANQAGITDVVITKFTPDGSTLVYSTYLGGGTAFNGAETVHSLIVNQNDELFLFGVTSSSDFPTTAGAYDNSFAGGTAINFPQNGTNFNTGTDLYITKFNATGTALIGSTYIGGSLNDGVNCNTNTALYDSLQHNYGDQFRGEIMVDKLGYCYVATCTKSPDFPIVNGFQTTMGGSQDAVVMKFNPTLTNLEWSTFLGGSSKDAAYSLKVDSAFNVFVTGGTSSPDFPITPGTINSTYKGGKADGFICKIDSAGGSIVNSTVVGTPSYDQSYFVEIDALGDVYIYGQTLLPSSYPIINATYSNPNSGQFVTKLDSTFANIQYSSQFGNGNGNINISPSAFLVDECGRIYISGWGANILQTTPLNGMPVTPDALQPGNGDGFNFYVAVFTTGFSSLGYATYFGGSSSQEHVDGGTSRFDPRGVIYQSVCAGCGGFSDFPTTPGAWSNTNNSGFCNNGVFKMSVQLPFTVADFDLPLEICKGYNYHFQNNSQSGTHYYWNFGDGDTSTLFEPYHTYQDTGMYTIMLVVVDSTFRVCIPADTIYKPVHIIENSPPLIMANDTICLGDGVYIGTSPVAGYLYSWTPTTALSSSTISNPYASPVSNTNYVLQIDKGYCVDTLHERVVINPNVPVPGFTFGEGFNCQGVFVTLVNTGTNFDDVYFVYNGDTLQPGDTIWVQFGGTINVVQFITKEGCVFQQGNTFTAGDFNSYFQNIDMPNVFTPFQTLGENDLFCPLGFNGDYCYEMIIYNRWGRSVYESSENGPCWDGYVNYTSIRATEGVYFYVIRFGGKEESGFFHLIAGGGN